MPELFKIVTHHLKACARDIAARRRGEPTSLDERAEMMLLTYREAGAR